MANNLEYTLRLKDLFSKTMQGAANQVKGLDGKMGALKKGISGVGSMIAGAFAVGAVISFGKAVFASLDNFQKFHASIKTMLHGNEYAAKALESQLITLAKTTPFQLTEVQDASKQLLAYGFKAGDVVDTMRTLGDVSSGIGAPLGDIAYLYGTLKTSGRVTLMDLKQFAGRGIPIYEVLAKRLNTTTENINKMVSSGKIGFKDIEGAFKDMTKEGGQFFNLMADQSKTVGGQLSNMEDSWEQLKVNIGKSQTGIISGTLNMANSFVSSLTDMMVAANGLDEALNKTNVSGASWMSKALGRLGYQTQGRKQEGEAFAYQQMVSESKTLKDVQLNLKVLEVLKKENEDRLELAKSSNDIDKRLRGISDYNVSMSLILEASKQLGGVAQLLNPKKDIPVTGAGGVDDGKGVKSLGTGTEVTGQRPQAINININELVHELNIQTNNMLEGAGRMKELVSKALLEAVNDINLIAMA
jgi:tape measure domain-containing protein